MGYKLEVNNNSYNINRYGNGVNSDQTPAQTQTIQPSFSGELPEEEKETSSNNNPLPFILGVAFTALIAKATHQTMNFSKAIKEAGLEEGCKISKLKMFFHNLNFVNWFGKGKTSEKLLEAGYAKLGNAERVFTSPAGDTLYVNGRKAFKVETGESIKPGDLKKAVKNGEEQISTATNKTNPGPKPLNDIEPYPSQKVLNRLKAINSDVEENIKSIKTIFMEELGYNPSLIEIQMKDFPSQGLFNPIISSGGFHFYSGEYILNKELMNNLSKEELAGLMRHELDHFDKAVKLCKSIGVDEYEKLFKEVDKKFLVGHDGKELTFNRAFWEKAIQNVDAAGFDAAKYSEALKSYLNIPVNYEPGAYGNYLSKVQYISNPFEVSAYNIQHSLEKGLNSSVTEHPSVRLKPIFNKADEELNALHSLLKNTPGLENSKAALFDYFYEKAIIESDTELASLYKQIKSSTTSGEKVVQRFQELMSKKINLLNGSIVLPADAAYEKQIFEATANLIKEGINSNEIIEALGSRQQTLIQQLTNIFNSAGQKDVLKRALGKNSDNLLAYLDSKNIDDADTILKLLLTKIHCENNISSMFAPEIEKLNIPNEVKERIFSNKTFIELLEKNNLEATLENNEAMLATVLQQTSLNI